ncbi:MAG: S-layer homology domain-containing protein, partial [Acidimicrobiia bacterium]
EEGVSLTTKHVGLVAAALLGLVFAAPLAVFASHQFVDVGDGHTFHQAIAWMADHGITLGCNPPDNNRYCPDDNVTRGQMAAFLKRLSEGSVVDARDSESLEGLSAAELATRVAFDSTEDAADGAGDKLFVEIVAPAPGTLVLDGSIDAWNHSEVGPAFCLFVVDGIGLNTSQRWIQIDGGTGTNEEENCSTNDGVVVGKGTHQVSLRFDTVNPGTTGITGTSLTVMWVPFDGNGDSPTP